MSEISKNKLYQRQTTLQEIGESGQEKLNNSSIAIIGCGGLGSVAAVYLAAGGIGNILLVDFDVVDTTNLHRQVFYTTNDIGKSKAQVLANHIRSISPFVKVQVSSLALDKSNVNSLIEKSNIILDCTDSLPVKYLLNDACVLNDKVLVYGSLYKFDGYVATFNYLDENESRTTNLRDAFPEIPTESIPNCSELGTLNSIVGIIGLMQANEVLKIVTGVGNPLVNSLLIYNSLDNSQFKMKLKPSVSKEQIQSIFNQENYEDLICEVDNPLEISQEKFKLILEDKSKTIRIISVIENVYQKLPFDVDLKMPISNFQNWVDEKDELLHEYILVCNRGISSLKATTAMSEKFPSAKIRSLIGGINSF